MKAGRILVTGASGLLGHAVVERLRSEFALLPLAHRHRADGMRAVDLSEATAWAAIEAEDWSALVHCAAFRSPDYCEEHRGEAWRLNALAPVRLAGLAARRGARMIHISTDYVFPGTRSPYREDDPCCPVNYYGLAKLAAERGVIDAYPAAAVLRIGALYGVPCATVGSPMLSEALQAVFAPAAVELDDRIVRYPLLVDDVADVIGFLLRHDAVGGVLHCGTQQGMTRYRWTRRIAGLLGMGVDHLLAATGDPARPAIRPVDVRLSTDRLRSVGGPVPPDVEERLPGVLARCGAWLLSQGMVARMK